MRVECRQFLCLFQLWDSYISCWDNILEYAPLKIVLKSVNIPFVDVFRSELMYRTCDIYYMHCIIGRFVYTYGVNYACAHVVAISCCYSFLVAYLACTTTTVVVGARA